MWKIKPNFVTFIIPSKGRPSLKKAIQSLINQTMSNWRCIIVFDGVEPPELGINYQDDNHFMIVRCSHQFHAGLVRNKAFPFIDTKWIAFLDDDDFLSETYVEKLMYYEDKYPDKDIIIFTYRDVENGNTQPPIWLDYIICCNVGISFAIKTEFLEEKGIQFTEGGLEDWRFLEECEQKGATYLITHSIQYFVGHRSAWS